jgi:hypothetical protein
MTLPAEIKKGTTMSFKENDDYAYNSTCRPPGGPSNGMVERRIDRKGQVIMTSTALDNVRQACDIRTSIQDENFRGGPTNLDYLQRDDRP